jgi:predicted TIM-barrel fold metal-dependent hydrolase
MIVDPHFHLHSACLAPGTPGWEAQRQQLALAGIPIEREAETLVHRAKAAGMDAIVAMNPFFHPEIGLPRTNKRLAEVIAPYRGYVYLIGGVSLWPRPDLAQLERDMEDCDLRAVKFVPSLARFYPNDFEFVGPVYDKCRELGLSIWWHIGGWQHGRARTIYCDLRFLDEVASRYPEVPQIVVHLGGGGSRADYQDAINLAGAHSNVYLEGSMLLRQLILSYFPLAEPGGASLGDRFLTEFLYRPRSDWSPGVGDAWDMARREHDYWIRFALNMAPERFIYASDSPYALDFGLAREMYDDLQLPRMLRDLVMGETARRLLRI